MKKSDVPHYNARLNLSRWCNKVVWLSYEERTDKIKSTQDFDSVLFRGLRVHRFSLLLNHNKVRPLEVTEFIDHAFIPTPVIREGWSIIRRYERRDGSYSHGFYPITTEADRLDCCIRQIIQRFMITPTNSINALTTFNEFVNEVLNDFSDSSNFKSISVSGLSDDTSMALSILLNSVDYMIYKLEKSKSKRKRRHISKSAKGFAA